MDNIAFKCTFNNGGNTFYVGYNGTCSEEIIKYNVESRKVWCSNSKCECKLYYDHGFKGDKPTFPCMESKLIKEQCFGAGSFHTGVKIGNKIKIDSERTGKNKIAILTTRYPDQKEIERRVIGLFLIDHLSDDNNLIFANPEYFILIPLEDASNLYFWDYYSICNGKASWGTGLFRYLSDNTTVNLISDLANSVRDQNTKGKIVDLLKLAFNMSPLANPFRGGPHSFITGNRLKNVLLKNKYGNGGEGENHKALKIFIANNAKLLGIDKVLKVDIEHTFASWDIVDILIESVDYDYTIEIETNIVMPGCHQAIKYRALRCAEKGLDLHSVKVKAIVVAWEFTEDETRFCEKYNIKQFKYKLEN